MNRGLVIKIAFGLALFVITAIGIISSLQAKEEKPIDNSNKYALTDFSEAKDITDVSSINYRSNFDLSIEKGVYEVNDAIYIIRKNSNSIYAKYVLDSQDVETLKEGNLSLYLSCSGNVEYLTFSYYIVKQNDVSRFESIYAKDKEGNIKDYIVQPMLQSYKLSSTIADKRLTKDEYTNNDETIFLVLMQSQKYNANYSVKISDSLGNEHINYQLTDYQMSVLKQDNYRLELDFSDVIDTLENRAATRYFTIRLYEDDKVINTLSFSINVSK